MTQSLFTSITGMTTSQSKLDVIANNIANMNTTAFKSSNLTFSELYNKTLSVGSGPTSTSGGTNPMQIGLGVGLAGISVDFTAGSVSSTGNTNDLNIQGTGWFTILNSDNSIGLTRDGSFSLDSAGNLVTQNGLKVLGTGTSYSTTTASLNPVKVPNELDIIKTGKDITTGDAGKISNFNNVKITTGTSSFTVNSTDGTEIAQITIDTSGCDTIQQIAEKFNNAIKANPALTDGDNSLVKAVVNSNGTFSLELNKVPSLKEVSDIKYGKIGDTSNFFAETGLSVASIEDDKYTSKVLSYQLEIGPATNSTASVSKTSFSVTKSGALAVTYSNGDTVSVEEDNNGGVVLKYTTADNQTIQSKDITISGGAITPANLQIQLATVQNEQGLLAQQGNLYKTGTNSGSLTFSIGNSNGFGEIGSGGLELSNVNLAIELANMIVAQRAIDANSRVFSTTSEVLQRLVNLQ